MTNRITVNVGVRDLTRAELVRMRRSFNNLGQDLNRAVGNRSRQNFARLSQSITQARRDLTNLRGAIPDDEFIRLDNAIRRSQRTMQRGFAGTSDRAFARVVAQVRRVEEGFQRLDRTGQIRIRVDDSAIRRADSRLAQWQRSTTRSVGSVNRSFSGMRTHSKVVFAAVIAIFAALPAALGVIAALLVPIFAAAFIGIGVLAFKSNAEVKAAFSDMKSSVAADVKSAASPMKGAIVDALGLLKKAAADARPALQEVFRGTAELTGPLTMALTDFIQSLLPGFAAALQGSVPVIRGMRDGLVSLGTGLSNMITLMTSNKEGLAEIWRILGEGIGKVLESIGEMTQAMIDNGSAAAVLEFIFSTLDTAIGLLDGTFRLLAGDMSAVELAWDGLIARAEENKRQSDEFFSVDWSGLWGSITSAVTGTKDATGELGGEFVGLISSATPMTEAIQAFADQALFRLKAEAAAAAEAVKALVAQFVDLNQKALGSMEAEAAFQEQLDKVTEAVRKHTGQLRFQNGELDLSDAKTRKLVQPLFDLASKTEAARAAAQKNGAAWSVQRGLMEEGRRGLIKAARDMGATRGEANRLADAILGIPGRKHVQFTTNAARIAEQIRSAQQSISDSMARMQSSGGILSGRAHGGVVGAGRAHGGVQGAANGGVRSNMTLVGEAGPEMVNLPPGSRVRSNPDTRRLLGGGGGGGGGSQLVIKSSGRRVDDMLIEILREAIHQRGGDPVVVLGG